MDCITTAITGIKCKMVSIYHSSIKDVQVMRCSSRRGTSLWALVLNLFDQCALSDSTFTPSTDNVFIRQLAG